MAKSNRDRMLLLILIGIAIFALSFMLVYRPTMAKKAELDAQLEVDRADLAELEEHYNQLDYYNSEMERAERYISSQMSRYPTDVRSEDQIMYVVALRDNAGADIASASFAAPEAMLSFMGIEKSGEEYIIKDCAAYQTAMDISCSLGYQDMKNMIDYINDTPMRTSLNALNISFDGGTGELAGSATVVKYFISSPGDAYEETTVPSVELGTDDLFVTVPKA